MDDSKAAFRGYLSPEETVVSAGDGTLIEQDRRADGVVCLTERRLLFVSTDGEFRAIDYGYVRTIRSRLRNSAVTRLWELRSVAILGATAAIVASLGAVVLASSALGALFTFAVIGGTVLAESVRRASVDGWHLRERLAGFDYDAVAERPFGNGRTPKPKRDGADGRKRWDWKTEYVYASLCLFFVAVSAAVVGAGGLLVYTGQPLLFVLGIIALGGIATTEYAIRRLRRLDCDAGGRADEREVWLELTGGDGVTIRCDASRRIDRPLSRLVTERASPPVREPARS